MNRKASICIILVLVLVLLVALGAGAQGKGGQSGNLGLVFNVLDLLMGLNPASDGVSAGVGLKYWLAQKSALRGILEFTYLSNSATDISSLNLGLSAAYEYHFVKARVSPYVGGLAGFHVSTITGGPNTFQFFLAGILGVEVTLIDSVALFAEYNLRMLFNDPNFSLGLGLGNAAQIGLIVYLP